MLTQVARMDYPIVDYTYDALGKRVLRSHYTANEIDQQTQYSYDGINILMERQRTRNQLDGSWMDWQTSATYTLAPGVVSHIISVHKSDGTDLFYHYDPIGNVMMVSNASGDTIAGYYQEGFGNVKQTVGSADNNYHLTTKELDSDTGLYYFYARWYDPEIGRFMSADPIFNVNYYTYVDNNPLINVDSLGLKKKNWWDFKYDNCDGADLLACIKECAEDGKEMESCKSIFKWDYWKRDWVKLPGSPSCNCKIPKPEKDKKCSVQKGPFPFPDFDIPEIRLPSWTYPAIGITGAAIIIILLPVGV